MRLILTHEQADFDAIASLLAARLLDERAIAALPVRVNRNVRGFLTLYGADLPLTPWHDLPRDPIEHITLVDTQTLPSVRGLSPKTPVQVIDHHPRRPDLPDHWRVHTEPIGATTTLLLEALQERHPHLTPIQATLLLLGIYEDTGSLSYEETTPRDVRAAAYLLEQGASLRLAHEFLNPPLTPQQQVVYDILLANAEIRNIHEAAIAVAHAEVEGLTDAISPLAHKLYETLEPDALFVLVSVAAGVQMVARASGDRIDLPAIVAHFGGGGHRRAAAALVKGATVEDVRAQLWEIIPRHVRPPLTVGDIMSRRPQVLSPDTPIEEADRLMRTFGYEGYPVVENGRVVGLLTRRAVDRALGHGLHLPVGRVMEAGEVTVRPQDSVVHLQQRMTDTGWGQIPVVDEDGEIIGIVTRTDLIKTLAPRPRRPGLHNLAARLESALPPARLALIKAIAAEAEAQHQALYIVGGFVRDLLLERPSLDFDLVVEGNAIALAHALRRRYGGRVTAHRKFGTAKWHLAPIRETLTAALASLSPHAQLDPADLPASIDLVSARTEFYARPTALPTVAHGSIKLDLHRRDFTINTLALRLDGRHYGELHDYWGGLDDLQRGIIRVLHSLSFVDDPTRMLRAVRFEQRFGFHIEPRTLQLLHDARDLLAKISGDRNRHELDAMLDEPRAAAMLARADQLGLLEAIYPGLRWTPAAEKRLAHLQEAPWPPPPPWDDLPSRLRGIPLKRALAYALWLMGTDAIAPTHLADLAARLGFPRALREVVQSAAALAARADGLLRGRPSQATFLLEEHPLAAVYALYLAAESADLQKVLRAYAGQWRHIRPHTDGHALRARGVPPGPRYKRILRALRAAWLDGEVHTPEEEARLLASLLARKTTSE
ncbi:MAG TPA: CBS domain-containing protein [Chloroflexi bacterium]|nr:CBS domain-containing protein [Chloroflexota bacterium]